MRRIIRNYARRLYCAVKYIGRPNWGRLMELHLIRESIELAVEEHEVMAQQAMAQLVIDGVIQFDEADLIEAALVKSGHMEYAKGEDLRQVNAQYDQLLHEAVSLGLVNEDDAAAPRSEAKDAESSFAAPRDVDPLRAMFGQYIAGGTATRNDPIVIIDTRDYVSIERIISEHILRSSGVEYELEQQGLQQISGRAVDELVYATKPAGAPSWTHRRRLFFDVTAGFSANAQI